jgi:hypothetical protein
MVEQCCLTVQYRSESGERTEERIELVTTPADVAKLVTRLALHVAAGEIARFTIEVAPSPYTVRQIPS